MDVKIKIEEKKYSRGWLWKMAWRDSRRSRSKLLLFTSSISIGIAALVGINSFKLNLEDEINSQAKSLLGADLVVNTNKPITEEKLQLLDSVGAERSNETSFASMIYFPRTDGTRLVQVRALSGPYPYYGAIETEPYYAAGDLQNGKYALVDEKLMLQYDVNIGDEVKVGEVTFEITGKLRKIPGQTGITSSVAPVVYIPYYYLWQTGLVKKGSRVNHYYYYLFENESQLNVALDNHQSRLEELAFGVETVEARKENTSNAFKNMAVFLNLAAFIALLLGCIGVASAVYIYLKEKNQSVAVLRCLGLKGHQAFLIYLYQIVMMGLVGSVVGCAVGVSFQYVLPGLLKEILPISITPQIYWLVVVQGMALGMFIAILFALLPLISIKDVSPLLSIRMAFNSHIKRKLHLYHYIIYGSIILFVSFFAYYQIDDLERSVYFLIGLTATFFLLIFISKMLMAGTRKLSIGSLSFRFRQGIANLYRPNNQSLLLIVTIGLCTVLLSTLFFIRFLLIDQISISGKGDRPNMVLFDIQSSQKEAVKALTLDYDLPVVQEVPVVTMRLREINGIDKNKAHNDSTIDYPNWFFNREYRVTFRDSLISSESIVEGKWTPSVQKGDSIFISMSEGFSKNLKLEIGDEILFNVQGALIKTYIGSFRKVDWRRVQTNFLVVFPTGVLEEAPQFHVLITKVDKSDVSARYQQAVVRTFPNISIIDLELILKTLDDVLGKVSFVINFMAAFSILTGIIVLAGSVVLSKSQRIQESVLLRTIGAVKKQVFSITAIEYFVLGGIAALTGLFLSHIFSWAMAEFLFEADYSFDGLSTLAIFVVITLATMVLGLMNIRPVLKNSPLQVLRREG